MYIISSNDTLVEFYKFPEAILEIILKYEKIVFFVFVVLSSFQ